MRSSWIEVDLEVIKRNVESIRKALKAGTKLMATVKGDAYGHGALESSKLLSSLGVDAFGVAFAEEGVELRRGGIKEPILIYGRTFPDSYSLLFDYDLTPNVFDVENARQLSEEAAQRGVRLKVHISIDTGLHRLGLSLNEETAQAVEEIMSMEGLYVEGIFSMMANSRLRKDFLEEDKEICRLQADRLKSLKSSLEKDGCLVPCWHIADSAGALLLPDTQMDMVRVGGALFGTWITDLSLESLSLKPAMSVFSRLACIRTLAEGEPLGYNGSYVTKKNSVIGVVPFGTVDGISGRASGRGHVLLHGVKCPIIGDTCMDQVIIDITEVKEPEIGDEIVIIGRQGEEDITAQEAAESAGVEDLEYLCRFNKRTPVHYTGNTDIKRGAHT